MAFKKIAQKTLIYYNEIYFYEVAFKQAHLYKFPFSFDGVLFHLFFYFLIFHISIFSLFFHTLFYKIKTTLLKIKHVTTDGMHGTSGTCTRQDRKWSEGSFTLDRMAWDPGIRGFFHIKTVWHI